MPITTKEPLGATTLNRKWYLDVNTGTFEAPVWTGVFGMTEMKPVNEGNMEDDSDFDGEGFESETQTTIKWGVEAKLKRGVRSAAPTAYDPGQEVLRLASLQMGIGNRVDIRYYEVTPSGPSVEAFRGFCAVSWEYEGGDMKALSFAEVTLTGQGKRTSIAHPGSVGVPVPAITLLTPATGPAAGGTLVIANGTDFLGATAVVVFGNTVPVADWEVVSNTALALKTPAHAAGQGDVVVTTPGGTSGTSAATKFTYV